MKANYYFRLILCIMAVQAAGLIGSIFTAPAIPGWYRELARPELTPPSWLFAPVWTVLYLLMGIALFLVWNNGVNKKGVPLALAVFGSQLALNVLWSVIFFGLRSPGWALVDIALLWLATGATIYVFNKVSRTAAWLLAPYLLWISFAAYLNYSIFTLNR